MVWPIIAAVAAAASGVAGGLGAADAKRNGAIAQGDAMKNAMTQIIAKLDAVGMPPDQSARLILDQYKQAGLFTPELEQQVKEAYSQFNNIKTDEATRGMQVKALERMGQYGQAGLTADERAAQRQAQAGVQRQNEANQQSIIQNLAARGQGGSGAEIAARLGASQAAAQQASEEGDRISAMAAQRALQAIAQQSNMAGQLRQQDYGEQSARAEAMDQMNRFNIGNQMAINQRNVASANQGQLTNLANKQSAMDKNTSMKNAEEYARLDRERQNWLDKLNYAKAYEAPLMGYGEAHGNQGKALGDSYAEQWSTLGNTMSNMFSKFAGMGGMGGAAGGANAGQGPTVANAQQQPGASMDWSKFLSSYGGK